MIYFNNDEHDYNPMKICIVCTKQINTENQIFYIRLDPIDNQIYCTECTIADIKRHKSGYDKMYPFKDVFYEKSFIRMNK